MELSTHTDTTEVRSIISWISWVSWMLELDFDFCRRQLGDPDSLIKQKSTQTFSVNEPQLLYLVY